MMSNATGPASMCAACGSAAGGAYCSSCGASLTGGAAPSVESMPLLGEPVAFVKTWFKVLRAPVAEPVRLATASSYKDHSTFLMLGVGAFVATMLFLASLGRGDAPLTANPAQQSFIDTFEPRLLIGYVVLCVIAYALFRITALANGAKLAVRPDVHAKLWAILVGFYLPLQAALIALALLAGLAIDAVAPGFGVTQAIQNSGPWFFLIFNVAMLVNFVLAHGQLWRAPLWLSAAIFAICLAAAPYPVNALLYAFGFAKGFLAAL